MKLYVGNLSRNTTEDELKEMFQAFGKVDSVAIIKDRMNNVSKGFGFVEMGVTEEAKAAISGLAGKEIDGRSLDVNEARPKPERSGGGGWNNRRGGGGSGGGRGKSGGGRRSW